MNVSDGASLVAHTVKSLPAMQETRVPSPGQEGLLEKDMATRSRARPRRLEINLLDCLSLCRLVSRIRSRDEPVCFLGFLTSASGGGGGGGIPDGLHPRPAFPHPSIDITAS